MQRRSLMRLRRHGITLSVYLRQLCPPLLGSNVTRSWYLGRGRAFSAIPSASPSDGSLFNYTSGAWLVNNKLRHAERKHVFNDQALLRLAAQSVGRDPSDVETMVKIGEGGFNRIFLIAMYDGFQMIARVPYPITRPKSYAVASEVATMDFLRLKGVPVPTVYDYSFSSDNAAQTEYIFMEYVKADKLTDVWLDFTETEVASVMRQIVELESHVMSLPFPAGGSLYYARDLGQLAKEQTSVPLPFEGGRFCVGPDVRVHMWYGRRSHLNVDRGPYVTAEATLTAAAQKEITYLKHFGKPILPFQRIRREAYNYEKQSPLDHIHNLERFLLIASSIIPKDPALQSFTIRHPDMRPNNIMISRSPESGEPKIVSLIDWQHASILPRFCLISVPENFRNDGDPFSRHLVLPSSPNLEEMQGPELMYAKRTHLARLVYHHYVKYTEAHKKFNDLNRAFQDPAFVLTLHLIDQSGAPWEGETHGLKELLIEAAERWETTAGAEVPCPIHFDPEDVAKTKAFDKRMQTADDNYRGVQFMLGFQSETWVPLEEYDLIKAEAEILKKTVFDDLSSDEEREQCRPHWLFDDMDEEDYM